MGHVLKKLDQGHGNMLEEKVCESYVCRYCGAASMAANYVGGVCIQVIARHNIACEAQAESGGNTRFITECQTCRHQTNEGCALPD